MVPTLRSPPARTGSRLLGALSVVAAGLAASYILLPDPLADVFFAGWVLSGVAFSLVGALAAWTNRTPLVWAAALALTALSIAGMWSIGLFVAPAAALLLGAALLSQAAGPRAGVREAIVADPPSTSEVALKTLGGVGSAAVGGWLVYAGAFERELFGACARETLNCAIEKAHWDAIGTTILGLTAIGLGGWLLWKQFYVARVLGSKNVG